MSRQFWSSANGVFYSIELKGEIFNLVRRTFYYPTLSKKISQKLYHFILLFEQLVFLAYQFFRDFQKHKTIFL